MKPGKAGLKEGLETAAVALKAVGKLGEKVSTRLQQAVESGQEKGQAARQA